MKNLDLNLSSHDYRSGTKTTLPRRRQFDERYEIHFFRRTVIGLAKGVKFKMTLVVH